MEQELEHLGSYRTRAAGPRAVVAEVVVEGERVILEDGRAAEIAAYGYRDPRRGDVVLCMTEGGTTYVVGVLRAPRPTIDELLEEAATPARVHDKHGRLLFEYHPDEDRAVLHVPSGDLALEVPAGALKITTRDGVAIESEGPVRATSGRAVELAARKEDGISARVSVQPGEVSLMSDAVTIAARQAHVVAGWIGLRADRLETHADRVRQVAEVIDVSAGRIVERARDAYREVERLSQHKAGRLKWIADTTISLVGEETLLKARGRMKIKGERIHLA